MFKWFGLSGRASDPALASTGDSPLRAVFFYGKIQIGVNYTRFSDSGKGAHFGSCRKMKEAEGKNRF